MKPFTIVGYWCSTGEPAVEHVSAESAAEAVKTWGNEIDRTGLIVVTVLSGHLMDELLLKEVAPASEVK